MSKPLPLRGRQPPRHFSKWLKLHPGLASLKCMTEDGSERSVKLHNGGKGVQALAMTARTVEKLGPSRVEALDDKGAVLGVFDFPPPAELDAPASPGYAPSESDTAEQSLLKTFAHLIADAHHASNKRLVETVDIISRNHAEERKQATLVIASVQRENERLRRSRMRIAVSDEGEDAATEGDDGAAELVELLKPMAAEYFRSKGMNGVVEGKG